MAGERRLHQIRELLPEPRTAGQIRKEKGYRANWELAYLLWNLSLIFGKAQATGLQPRVAEHKQIRATSMGLATCCSARSGEDSLHD